MRESARIGYAQARVQARFGDRPADPFWRELEAGRDFPHLVDWVRSSVLADAVAAVPADIGVHALEARLRRHWAATCDEIAGWYPASSQAAIRWLKWLPLLPALTWLAQGRTVPPWMLEDPALGAIASAGPADRSERLAGTPLAPLAMEFAAAGDLAAAWHRAWRDRWTGTDHAAFARLERALSRLLPGGRTDAGEGFDALLEATGAEARRLFRRHVCSPLAGTCLLVMLWLDHQRLRAALVQARLFGAGEPA